MARGIAISVVLLLQPALASATTWRTVERSAWRMSMPSSWTLDRVCHYGADNRRATWRFVSPNRNYKLTVRVEREGKTPLKVLAEKRWARFAERAEEVEVVKQEAVQVEGRELHLRIARASEIRKKNAQPYAVLFLMTRSPTRKVLVGLTVKASAERLEDFLRTVERLASSLDLKELKRRPAVRAVKTRAVKGRR